MGSGDAGSIRDGWATNDRLTNPIIFIESKTMLSFGVFNRCAYVCQAKDGYKNISIGSPPGGAKSPKLCLVGSTPTLPANFNRANPATNGEITIDDDWTTRHGCCMRKPRSGSHDLERDIIIIRRLC